MSPTLMSFTLPTGFRFMLSHEAERLSQGSSIVLYNGESCHGTVKSFGDATMTVTLRSGAIVVLDLDDPDYWGEDEARERRPPMDAAGEFVAIREVLATPDAEIEPLMRTSVGLERLAKNDPELKAALAEVRRILIDRLKGKAA